MKMDFLQALEANKKKVVYRTGVYSHKFKVDELRSCTYLNLLDFEGEWDAEELPQVVEFEMDMSAIQMDTLAVYMQPLYGKRWKIVATEIK